MDKKENIPTAFLTSKPLFYVKGLLVFFFVLCATLAQAQVATKIDTTTITIGEELQYQVEVIADTTDLVVFPEGQQFLPLEVIESYKTDTILKGSKFQLLKKYGLTQFDSGAYSIPSQRIIINDRIVKTDTFRIYVNDVVVDTTKQKMFEIKDKLEVERPGFNWFKILLVLAILGVLGGLFFYYFRRKKIEAAKKEALPPFEEALFSLENLDKAALLEQNNSKAYYSQLTEIVKRYLDREVDETALESTTDELMARLQLQKDAGKFDFDTNLLKELYAILRRADLVKFAKMQQDAGQARADRASIEHIIKDTHEAIPEPTEEELLADELYKEAMLKKRRRKNFIKGAAITLALLIISTGIAIATLGFPAVRDAVIGNNMRDLQEGEWIKSEYGVPAVVLSTPDVLVRVPLEIPEEVATTIKASSAFGYGNLQDDLYVFVNSFQFTNEAEVSLDATIEDGLSKIEKGGVANLLVKKDEFETPNGIKGMRATGTFNVKQGKNFKQQEYQYVVFGQAGAVQQILMVNNKQNLYAKQIVERIVASIELELTQGGQ